MGTMKLTKHIQNLQTLSKGEHSLVEVFDLIAEENIATLNRLRKALGKKPLHVHKPYLPDVAKEFCPDCGKGISVRLELREGGHSEEVGYCSCGYTETT